MHSTQTTMISMRAAASAFIIRLPRPAPADKNSSLPTEVTQAKAKACSTPAAMPGSAAGNRISQSCCQRPSISTWAASRCWPATWRRLSKVLSTMGYNAARLTISSLAPSPLPSHRAISGIQPSIGTWRKAWNSGAIRRLAGVDRAINAPRPTPPTMPMARPLQVRNRLAHRLISNSPLPSSSASAVPTCASGTKA
ncbi:hypothetical protein D3C76_1080310 [compost metagenome]